MLAGPDEALAKRRMAWFDENRRHSAFSPLSISGLVGWWDFSDATKLYTDAGTTLVSADADLIYQANDKSASAYHVSQATSGKRPAYKVNIRNGKSVGRFAGGTNDAANGDNLTSGVASVAQPITRFFVGFTSDTASLSRFAVSDGATNVAGPLIGVSGAGDQGMGAGSNRLSTVGSDTNWHVWAMLFNTTSSTYRIDGGADTLANHLTIGTGAITVYNIGSYTAQFYHWSGDIGEIIDYAAALSLTDINTIGNYLATKWGTTWVAAS
jgi:hypothetical protein